MAWAQLWLQLNPHNFMHIQLQAKYGLAEHAHRALAGQPLGLVHTHGRYGPTGFCGYGRETRQQNNQSRVRGEKRNSK